VYDDSAMGPPSHDPNPGDDLAALDPNGIARAPAIGEDRSPNAAVCPFLRSIDEENALGLPVESPHQANRCAAIGEAVPQSLRQQELVCLTSGHVNCPRYLRGSTDTDELPVLVPANRAVTPPIAAALAVFVGAFLVSLAFVVSNGGLVLTPAAPTASGGIADVLASASPSLAPTPEPTPVPSLAPTPEPSLAPTPEPSLAPTPLPSTSSTPAATAKPTAKPTSNRLALLKPCPDKPNCYLYVIRSGDNLYSIANYFGVPLSTIKTLNPWTSSGLKVGRALQLPPPTR